MENNNDKKHENPRTDKPQTGKIRSKKKRRRKIIIYTLSALVFLFLVVLPALLNMFADRIIGKSLSEIVRRESNQKYSLTYSDVSFNVFRNNITLDSVRLVPDSALIYSDQIPHPEYIKLLIPKVYLKGATWINAILKRELIIEDFVIDKADIYLSLNEGYEPQESDSTSTDSLAFEHKHLHGFIAPYLELFKLKQFHFRKAWLTMNIHHPDKTDTLNLQNFSMAISNFQLDSLAHTRSQRLFFSDSLGMNLREGLFRYSSDAFELSFYNMGLSSVNGKLILDQMHVVKYDNTGIDKSKQDFTADIQKLALTGLDFIEIMETGNLKLDALEFDHPALIFYGATTTKTDSLDLYQMSHHLLNSLKPQINLLDIDTVKINNGSMLWPEKTTAGIRDLEIPNFDLRLTRLFIDSASLLPRSRFFFVDDFWFKSYRQYLDMPGPGLQIAYDTLMLNSASNRLHISGLDLKQKDSAASSDIHLFVPELALVSKDFKADLIDQSISLNTLELLDASLRARTKNKKRQKSKVDIYNLYPLIAENLKWIEIDHLRLVNSDIDVAHKSGKNLPWTMTGRLNFELTGFKLNEKRKNSRRIFYSDALWWDMQNVVADLPSSGYMLSADDLGVNTVESSLHIQNLSVDTSLRKIVRSQNKIILSSLDLAQVDILGLDYPSLYFEGDVFVDTLILDQPKLDLILDKKIEQANTQAVLTKFNYRIGDLQIIDGQFGMSEKMQPHPFFTIADADVEIFNVHPSLQGDGQSVDARGIELRLAKLFFAQPDSIYTFKMEQVMLSSADSLVAFKNIYVEPNYEGSIEGLDLVDLFVPELTIRSIPLFDFYHKNALQAGLLKISNPKIQYLKGNQIKPSASFLDFDPEIIKNYALKSLDRISLDSIALTDARFNYGKHGRPGPFLLSAVGVDLTVMDFDLNEETKMESSNLFYTADIRFNADSIHFVPEGGSEKLIARNLNLSTAAQFFTIASLDMKAKAGTSKTVATKLATRNIATHGLDYYKLIDEKKLDFISLEIEKPNLVLPGGKQKADAKADSIHRFNAYELIKDHLYEISAGELRMDEARLIIPRTNARQKKSYLFEQIDFEIKNILIDSANRLFDNKFLYSDDFCFRLHHFTENSIDSLYRFGAKEIAFSSKDALLIVDDGYLKPNYPDSVFFAKVGVQTDILDLTFETARLHKLRLLDLIVDKILWVDMLEIDGLQGSAYRSKAYPRPLNHKPKMPATALQSLDFILRLDTFEVSNSHFMYREFLPPAIQPGEIWFSDIQVKAHNITNSKDKIADNPTMDIHANAMMMDEGALDLDLKFDIKNKNDFWVGTGNISPFDLTLLNPMLEHIAFVKVTKGTNENLSFNVEADINRATGEMKFEYEKLHIRLIDKKTLSTQGIGESIASFIANTFVVRGKNPKFPFGMREGDIYFSRDTTRSFFNYLTKSALSGVSSTIRGTNEERKEKRQKRNMERDLRKMGRLDEKNMRKLQRAGEPE